MNNLAQIVEAIKKDFSVNSKGEGFISFRAAAKLLGINQSTLTRAFQGDAFSTSKLAQKLTAQGFKCDDFSRTGIPDIALSVIVEYYAFDAGERCTEQARLVFKAFAAIGIRSWIQEVVGYKKDTSSQLTNIYARRVQIASNWNILKGYFCVFHEISLLANKIGQEYQVGEYDLIDGSVGKCWSKYRKKQEWALPTIKFPIEFGDKRDSAHVEVTGYSNHELIHFREWLEDIYRYENLPKYLSGKYSGIL